jgi:hypothetical protein
VHLSRSLVATVVLSTFLFTGACVAATRADAQTPRPTISVSPATGVAPGSMVTVSGSGFAPGGGVYVMFCARPTGELGTQGGRAASSTCNPDQSNDHTVWKTPIPADGTFSVQLKVESTFASTDCTKTTCGVFVRKDHMGGASDYSQDAFAPVTFSAAAAPTPAPATATPPAPAARPATGNAAVAGAATTAAPQLAQTGLDPLVPLAGLLALLGGSWLVLLNRRARATTR